MAAEGFADDRNAKERELLTGNARVCFRKQGQSSHFGPMLLFVYSTGIW